MEVSFKESNYLLGRLSFLDDNDLDDYDPGSYHDYLNRRYFGKGIAVSPDPFWTFVQDIKESNKTWENLYE